MKKKTFYILFLALLQSIPLLAQLDSINKLDEVVLSDVRLYSNSKGNRVQVLRDSVLEKNSPSLTSALKFNTPIYFRENGQGMVSSASFRGTTASQTAVIWNGININSRFNGQTDFNTLLTSNYDEVAIRSGGGSVLYGSGAIGGSVHLNNKFRFGNGFENEIRLKYGSFDTFFGSYFSGYSTEKTSIQLNISNYSSENDFDYAGTEKKNENGDFQNTGFSFSLAHLLNKKNTLKFYTNYFEGERGFSGTLTAPSNSKYEDVNSRNLLEWKGLYGNFTSNLRLAYLDETYRYFENRAQEEHTFGRAKTGIVKYDLAYSINSAMSLSGIADIQKTKGEGTNIGEAQRTTGSVGLLFEHDLNRFSYEINARKEFSNVYESPLLFSLTSKYEITDFYGLRLNFSRNYRIPSFNDLFWTTGGNLELNPEESLQAELGQVFKFKDFNFGLTGYVIEIDNLLRWVPGEDGFWRPENTESVRNYGLEAVLEWGKTFGNHHINFAGTYAYTKSRDLAIEKDLIYVPENKATASVSYEFERVSAFYQFLYQGAVYTSSDNNYTLDGYTLSNFGVEYGLLKNKNLVLGIEIKNLWNTTYQSMPSRPMPGRSITSKLTFKF